MILRWVCKKCNLKWIYPVGRCIDCGEELVKEKGTKFKVIGLTKVSIPSPYHPFVPYNVLVLEDEHGNRAPRKTMKDYSIGDEFVLEKSGAPDAVAITKLKYDYYDAVTEALELISFDIKPGKVLIFPGLTAASYPFLALNTNPEVLDALMQLLKENKVEDITVAFGSEPGVKVDAAAAKSGLLKICKKHGAKVLDLSASSYKGLEHEGTKYSISEAFFDKDLIINLPVMKTSTQTIVAGALENMKRAADAETINQIHKRGLDEGIAALNKLMPAYLTLGDASKGMQGKGPGTEGEPGFYNIIFASRDPVALDTVFSEMLMLEKAAHIEKAASYGIGTSDLRKIKVLGADLDSVKFEGKPAYGNLSSHPNIEIIDGNETALALQHLKLALMKLATKRGDKLYLITGSPKKDLVEGKERLVAVGDSAIAFAEENNIGLIGSIAGDPPELNDLIVFIGKYLTNEGKVSINLIDKAKSKIIKGAIKLKNAKR